MRNKVEPFGGELSDLFLASLSSLSFLLLDLMVARAAYPKNARSIG
jgi:hypothetical protein